MAKLLAQEESFLPFTHEDNFPSLESLEVVSNANENLQTLLRLQFPEFIAAFTDVKVAGFFSTFLCYKLRRADKVVLSIKPDGGGDVPKALLVKFRQAMANLSRRVLCAFHRTLFDPMRKSFLSDRDYGTFLYDNFVFDIPKLLDIASLYGSGPNNAKLVREMFACIFSLQPKYAADLRQGFGHMATVVNSIAQKVLVAKSGATSGATSSGGSNSSSKFSKPSGSRSVSLAPSTGKSFNMSALVAYATEILLTALSFLQCFPEGAEAAVAPAPNGTDGAGEFGFVLALQQLYEEVLPYLQQSATDQHTHAVVGGAQNIVLSVFNALMDHCPLRQMRKRATRELAFSQLVQLFTTMADESTADPETASASSLLLDFNFKYNFVAKISRYQSPQRSYIDSIFPDPAVVNAHMLSLAKAKAEDQPTEAATTSETADGASSTSDKAAYLHSKNVQAAVSQIKALLPALGDGFVAACLDAVAVSMGRTNCADSPHEGGAVAGIEQALDCLLEKNYPKHMEKLREDASLQDYEGTLRLRNALPTISASMQPANTGNSNSTSSSGAGTKKSYKNRPQNVVIGESADDIDDERLRQKVLRAFNSYDLYNDDFNDDGRYDPAERVSVEPMSPFNYDEEDNGSSGGGNGDAGMVAVVANPNHRGRGGARTAAEKLLSASAAQSAPRAAAASTSALFALQTQLSKLDRKARDYDRKSTFLREQIRQHKQRLGIGRQQGGAGSSASQKSQNGGSASSSKPQFGRQRQRPKPAPAKPKKQNPQQRNSDNKTKSKKSPTPQRARGASGGTSKGGNGGGGGGGGGGGSGDGSKGSKNSSRSRRFKQQNKSRIANHRRKAGALKKQGGAGAR